MTSDSIWSIHAAASARRETHYVDPETGYRVFTAWGLSQRDSCCGSGCRHCPYDHAEVSLERRADVTKQPAWLTENTPDSDAVDVLFWSSGKDSYLTLRALQREALRPVVLLTTFDVHTRTVAHQDVAIANVVRQAEHLRLPLLGIPLYQEKAYTEHIAGALDLIPSVARLVFGDLHLEHIRNWREDAFADIARARTAELHFPIWHASYDELVNELEASGVVCEISAVTEPVEGIIEVGEVFNRDLIARLPESVDIMGENGEFHSLAKVWEVQGSKESR